MSNSTYTYNLMGALLMEVEFKDSFKDFKLGHLIKIGLTNDKELKFKIIKVEAGEVVVEQLFNNPEVVKRTYLFNKKSLNFDNLTFYEYKNGTKGKELTEKITDFTISKEPIDSENQNAGFIDIDLTSDNDNIDVLTDDVEKMNNTLKNLEVGNIFNILTVEKNKKNKGDLSNNMFFEVVKKGDNVISIKLIDIKHGEDTESNRLKYFEKVVKNTYVLLNYNNLVRNVGDNLLLDFAKIENGKSLAFTLDGIENITIEDSEGSENSSTMSKEEFEEKVRNSPNSQAFLDALYKIPNFTDILTNASPLGVSQIFNKVSDFVEEKSYLTKGKFLEVTILNDTVFATKSSKKLVKQRNNNKISYKGKVIKERTILIGNQNDKRGYWILKIDKEISDSTFLVTVQHCNNRGECNVEKTNLNVRLNNL